MKIHKLIPFYSILLLVLLFEVLILTHTFNIITLDDVNVRTTLARLYALIALIILNVVNLTLGAVCLHNIIMYYTKLNKAIKDIKDFADVMNKILQDKKDKRNHDMNRPLSDLRTRPVTEEESFKGHGDMFIKKEDNSNYPDNLKANKPT
jgi:hypothetical protein